MHFINNTIKYFLIVLFVFSFGKVVPQSCPGSLLLDANNLAVDLPSTNQYYSGTNSGYTWECWFKLNQPFGADMRPLICALDGVLFEDQWLGFGWQGGWFNEPVTRLVFKVDGPSSAFPTGPNCSYEPIGGFVIGTWYHAAGVMDYANQIAKLYVNGVLVDSKPITTAPITRVIPTQLGLNFGGTIMPLYGNMDEVRIWTRVLSASEIASNFDKCLSGSEPNLFLYYRCNQPGGSAVLDATINNNTGVFSNAPSWSTQQPIITGTACASASSSFSVNVTSICQANNTANATATVSSNAISPSFSYSWTNSSGVVVSQTNNTTTFSNTVSNLANGLYTLTAQMNTACGTVTSLTKTLSVNCTSSLTIPPCKGIMTGTGMSICNQYSFSITPSQTITPFNYGSQGYACTGATMPDVSFNILGPPWRVMKNNWFFQSSVAGEIRGFTSSGVLQTIPFSPSQTITPLSYSGTFVQFAINGVATGSLVNQATYSISLASSLHSSNNYTYCPTSSSVAISPTIPSQGGPWTYSWQPGGLTGNPINVNPLTNTVYTVTATSSGGCVSTTSVNVSINCPQPPLCSGNQGNFVFLEDFGSGNMLYGPALPAGTTNYIYQTGTPANGTYVISNLSNPSGVNAGYVNDGDHTGNLNGYMMVVNSDYPASEVYRKQVTGLCQNTTYVFSAYLSNNNTPSTPTTVCGGYVYANVKFQIEYPLGTIQNFVTTGNLPLGLSNTTLNWQQYGFSFTTLPGQTSVDIVLKNNAPGGCGNDYVVDDISLAPCGPGVALSIVPNQTVFCIGDAVDMQSNFTSGSYINPQYQWQFSNDGGVTWANVTGATSPNYNISSLSSAQGGQYQLLVSENGNITSSSCRIIAGPIGFSVSNGVTVVSSSTICLGASSIISASGVSTYNWSNGATTNSISVSPTSTTIYSVTGSVGTCTSQAITTVSVIPSYSISVSGNTLICSGQTATLTANGAPSYSWSNGASTSSLVVTPNVNATYSASASGSLCANTSAITVSVIPMPTITVSSNTSICQGNGSATLTAIGASTYTWTNSSSLSSPTSNSVIASPNMTSSYTVTGVTGICSNTAAVTVSVNLSPTITAVSYSNTTCGLSNGAITISSLPVANTYTWSSGIGSISNSVSSLSAGNYTVSAFNGVCHVSTVVPISSSIPLQIITSTITGSDCGINNGSIFLTDNYTNSIYSWTPNVSATNSLTNLAPGSYSVLISNGASCSTSSVFVVNQLNGPSSITVNQNNTICESTNGSISITSVSNGVSPYQFSFDNNGYTSVSTFSNLAQGIYTITVKDANGCVYTNTYTIEKLSVTSNIELTKKFPTCNANDGSFVISNITGGTGPFLLSFNGLLFATDTIFEEVGPGSYSLVIRDSNLCETNLILEMPIDKNDYTLYVPNTFTPNKDLLNDTWFAKATCINAFNCLIFNRWGEKIMELKDINEAWDGTYKGKNVPDGVYVYLIEAETNDGTIYKNGHITLFR